MNPILYSLAKRFLFCMSPETAHEFTLSALRTADKLHLCSLIGGRRVSDPVTVMGLNFPNRVGLAAGMDKQANTFPAFGHLGFGFVEVGTLTPRPQPGNPKPRCFRCIPQQAIINHMGINNPGIEVGVANIRAAKGFSGVLGINISKNESTPNDEARMDYLTCLREAWPVADYITINFSCPNVPHLCELARADSAADLLAALKSEQANLSSETGRHVPIVMKVSPDMSESQIRELSGVFLDCQLDGLICTNTTTSREGVEGHPAAAQKGGLSGKPLYNKANETLEAFASHLKGRIPIIGVGGIMSADDAEAKIRAGASLVQLYSGFIFKGPQLIRDCAVRLRDMR
ncbi:MAG TPA: quinone-dependent dihydroorotate dehydrogenase [Candidatus Akkermansia intestinavium]|nr:quinone-dependent dihydroorotate dehydrogenase [Candidatus Akkermansia intestinavium]